MDSPKQPVKNLWWCPRGMAPELAAVQAPEGSSLDDLEWGLALERRVQQLVDKEPDPERAARWAAKAMGRPGMTGHLYAGEVLVRHNLELMTSLMVLAQSQARNPFPGKVLVESPAVRQAAEETDLETWVELAVAQVSPYSRD